MCHKIVAERQTSDNPIIVLVVSVLAVDKGRILSPSIILSHGFRRVVCGRWQWRACGVVRSMTTCRKTVATTATAADYRVV